MSQKESVSFAILALEVLKTQPQFLPSRYGGSEVVTEMLELLRAIPEQAAEHAAAEAQATEAAQALVASHLDKLRVTFQTDGTPKSRIAVRFQWA